MVKNQKKAEEHKKEIEGRKSNPAGLRCCKCKVLNVWRIKLRQCGHFVCITCILEHIMYWIEEENKVRIKCTKSTCPKHIHENDIDAVLDPDNDDLETFMKRAKREYLLHEHRKHSIYYAFAGLIQRCPLCKALYTEYNGCNFVQCVNIRCKQRFCWLCNEPTESLQHFAGGTCKLGWDDLFKICFILKFLAFTEGCLLIIFLPLVSTTLIAVALYPIMMLAAVPFAIGSLIFLIPMSVAYCTIAIIKCIPAFSRINGVPFYEKIMKPTVNMK
uniref:BMA-TAG-314 n=1 Tax=Brugia malayi TaxID=6279 RepID=A0A5S6PKG0_BRUMA